MWPLASESMATQGGSPARPPRHVCSGTVPSAPWSLLWHPDGPYTSLSKFGSPAENYSFGSCGVSELNYSLHSSQQMPEPITRAGLEEGNFPLSAAASPVRGSRPELQSSLNPPDLWCLILSLPQPSGLSLTHFRC